MKAKSILFLALTVMVLGSQAQSIYVRGGLGPAISTAPHMDYQYTTLYQEFSQQVTTEAKRGGLGNGLPIVVAAGYYFSDNFGVEMGVDYFYGFSVKTVNSTNDITSTYKEHGTMLALVPAFVLRINSDKIKPYARLGLMIGVLNSEKYSLEKSDASRAFTSKDYGGISIGAQAAMGAEFPLSDLISIFGEVNLDGISWAPKKGKYTEHSTNGTDDLGSMTTRDKTWLYEKTINSTDVIPASDPNKKSLINYSFANVGLVFGVKINIGK